MRWIRDSMEGTGTKKSYLYMKDIRRQKSNDETTGNSREEGEEMKEEEEEEEEEKEEGEGSIRGRG